MCMASNNNSSPAAPGPPPRFSEKSLTQAFGSGLLAGSVCHSLTVFSHLEGTGPLQIFPNECALGFALASTGACAVHTQDIRSSLIHGATAGLGSLMAGWALRCCFRERKKHWPVMVDVATSPALHNSGGYGPGMGVDGTSAIGTFSPKGPDSPHASRGWAAEMCETLLLQDRERSAAARK